MYEAAIPNLFTLGNLYSGFLSIGYASLGYYKSAAILVLIGMMLDSLDGRVARLLRVDSQMGKELDSLADVVTFGAKTSCFNVLHIFLKLRNHRIIHSGIIPSFRSISFSTI